MRTRCPRAPRAAALIAAALAAASLAAAAPDKDYYFPEVRIDIAVERGGDLVVDEFRTFAFEGRFRYAYLVIPLRMDRPGPGREISITGLTVTDESGAPLRTEVTTEGGRLTAKWFYSASDERRTFRVRYRVGGAVTTYADATELYWKAIGDEWDRPARDVRVTVSLPEAVSSRSELLVWAHGPLTGWAEVVDERTARFSSPELAARQFFEVRVVWPNGPVAGVPSDALDLAAIRAEEKAFAAIQSGLRSVRRLSAPWSIPLRRIAGLLGGHIRSLRCFFTPFRSTDSAPTQLARLALSLAQTRFGGFQGNSPHPSPELLNHRNALFDDTPRIPFALRLRAAQPRLRSSA